MKELEITIVGLSHYVSDCNAFVSNLAKGTEVLMMAEPSNPFDRNAIKAFVEGKHVGYVARDMASDVLPYLAQSRGVLIGTVTSAIYKEIHITVNVSGFAEVAANEEKEPIFDKALALNDNLIAPFLPEDEIFLMDLSMTEYYLSMGGTQSEALQNYMTSYTKASQHSLSYESTKTSLELVCKFTKLLQLPETPLQNYKDNIETLLLDLHEYKKDKASCAAQIYNYKYTKLKDEAFCEGGTFERILLAETGTKDPDFDQVKQLNDRMEQFLLSLPNNTYRLLYDKPADWAKALMYLAPSLKDIYIICTHAMVLDWAKQRLAKEARENFDLRDLSLAMLDREKIFDPSFDRNRLLKIYGRMKALIDGFGEKADYAWLFLACCNLKYLVKNNAYTAFANTLTDLKLTNEDSKTISNNIKTNVKKHQDGNIDPERRKQIMKTIMDYENFIR